MIYGIFMKVGSAFLCYRVPPQSPAKVRVSLSDPSLSLFPLEYEYTEEEGREERRRKRRRSGRRRKEKKYQNKLRKLLKIN